MKLNIGGQKGRGKKDFHGWSIVDIRKGAEFCLDIMEEKLPIKNNSVEAIYSSHTLEHIFPDKMLFVLKEWSRVLVNQGIIRVVVPDIDKAIDAYTRRDMNYLKDKRNPRKIECLPTKPLCFLSSWFFTYKQEAKGHKRLIGGHVMSFNYELLEYYLIKAGFKHIERKSYTDKSQVFSQCDFERYKDCSIYVEAIK